MTGRTLATLYDQLRPEERFRAVLEAMARDDGEEARRLAATCPMKVYRESDAAYGNRWNAVRLIVFTFALDVWPDLRVAEMLGSFKGWIRLFLCHSDDSEATKGESPSEEPKPKKKPKPGNELATSLLESLEVQLSVQEMIFTRAKARIAAFDTFCKARFELDGVTVLRAWAPNFSADVHNAMEVMAQIPSDDEKVAEYRTMLDRIFVQEVGIGMGGNTGESRMQ